MPRCLLRIENPISSVGSVVRSDFVKLDIGNKQSFATVVPDEAMIGPAVFVAITIHARDDYSFIWCVRALDLAF